MLVLGLVDLPIWLILILSIILGFYIYTARIHRIFNKYGLVGPKPAPFIGGIPMLKKKGITACIEEGTIKYGKCFSFFVGNLPTVFLTDTDMIKEIFDKRFSTYPNRSKVIYPSKFWEHSVLWSTKHDHWKFLRSAIAPIFSSGKLKRVNPLVLACIDNMIDKVKEQLKTTDALDMLPILKSLTMDITCRAVLGVEIGQNKELLQQVSDLLNISDTIEKNPVLNLILLIPDAKYICKLFDIDYNNTKAIKYIRTTLQQIVDERKQNPSSRKEDLLQLMLDSQNESLKENQEKIIASDRGMTDEELIANAMTFMFGGYDTTASALTFSVYFLATEPECYAKLCKEIHREIGRYKLTYESVNSLKYLDMFVLEVMRLYPTITRISRHNEEEITIGQYTFPPNISISVPVFNLQRMEEYWPDPLKFKPERFSPENKANILPYTYMPFGGGPRNCIGSRFALMELKVTLVRFLQTFRFKPSESLTIPPELERNILCRPVGGMPLCVEII